MLKKAILELVIKKGCEIYFIENGDMISYDAKKSEFYFNENLINKKDVEEKLDDYIDFYNIHIYVIERLIEIGQIIERWYNMNKNTKNKDIMFYCLGITYICVVLYSIIKMC